MTRAARSAGCRYALLAVGAGILLLLVGVFAPIGMLFFVPIFDFWYVGPAAALLAFVLHRLQLWPRVALILGFVGVAWITFLVAWYVFVVVMFAVLGPFGP